MKPDARAWPDKSREIKEARVCRNFVFTITTQQPIRLLLQRQHQVGYILKIHSVPVLSRPSPFDLKDFLTIKSEAQEVSSSGVFQNNANKISTTVSNTVDSRYLDFGYLE